MVRFPQCTECSYLDYSDKDNFKCPAFPDGIPKDVLWGKISHRVYGGIRQRPRGGVGCDGLKYRTNHDAPAPWFFYARK